MNLMKIFEAGMVRRYHAKRVIHEQTVGEHTWGVCVVLMWLYFPDLPPPKLFQHALFHDVPELITGDTPAPAKWRSKPLAAALADLEQEVAEELGLPTLDYSPVLGFSDNAELVMHSLSEASMGNRLFLDTARRGIARMREYLLPQEMRQRGDALTAELVVRLQDHERR